VGVTVAVRLNGVLGDVVDTEGSSATCVVVSPTGALAAPEELMA
jgi:hypothetical protein